MMQSGTHSRPVALDENIRPQDGMTLYRRTCGTCKSIDCLHSCGIITEILSPITDKGRIVCVDEPPTRSIRGHILPEPAMCKDCNVHSTVVGGLLASIEVVGSQIEILHDRSVWISLNSVQVKEIRCLVFVTMPQISASRYSFLSAPQRPWDLKRFGVGQYQTASRARGFSKCHAICSFQSAYLQRIAKLSRVHRTTAVRFSMLPAILA